MAISLPTEPAQGREHTYSTVLAGLPMRTASRKVQRVCCLALYGIHLGALKYLNLSTTLGSYPQVGAPLLIREMIS
jgi:hypothetical protein